MIHSEVEADDLQFCPICQVPLKSLKIIHTRHISMCDILWDELPDCVDGTECRNESIFHFRDFSHRVLATYRENVSKRKIEDLDDISEDNPKLKLKENRGAVAYNLDADDDDNVFINTNSKVKRNTKSVSDTNKKRTQGRKKSLNSKSTSGRILMAEGSGNPCDSKTKNTRFSSSPGKGELKRLNFSDREVNGQAYETSVVNNEPRNIRKRTDSCKQDCELVADKTDYSPVEYDEATGINYSNDGDEVANCTTISNDSNQDDPVLFNSDWEDIEERVNENVEKKEKCKAEWNNLFKCGTKVVTQERETSSRENKKKSIFSKPAKVCPSLKKIPGTGFAVDAFQFGNIPGITTYFLTHFHADHYIGLRKSFSNPIYCTLITANLVKKKLRVDEKYLNVLELNEPRIINRVEITCFDANHCPGAVIILFRLMNGEQFLHVGDFRACEDMEQIPELRNAHIDKLYLDTTYFNPQYVFPTQTEAVDRVKKIVADMSSKHKQALFICGTYSIGKEKVFLGMLEVLKCKLWAQPPKVDIFRCMNNKVILSALTSNPAEAKIHVLPMNYLRFDKLQQYLLDLNSQFKHVFAFKPTGWEMGRKTLSDDWINKLSKDNITIYGVPYSEHSNYEELCRFVKFVEADKVIPTVPMKNREMYAVLKSLVDSYRGGPKQLSITDFISK